MHSLKQDIVMFSCRVCDSFFLPAELSVLMIIQLLFYMSISLRMAMCGGLHKSVTQSSYAGVARCAVQSATASVTPTRASSMRRSQSGISASTFTASMKAAASVSTVRSAYDNFLIN